MNEYQHPITFCPTGNLIQDYKNAFEDYELNLTPHLPINKDAHFLDVGCGWGQFLLWLKKKGYSNLEGVDIGLAQVEYCRSLGLDVHRASESGLFLSERPNSFDMVSMHHVIEHVPPSAAIDLLRAIYNSLRPGGIAIVQTPNMSAVSAGFSRYIEMTHLNGYTESSFHEVLRLAGFSNIVVFGNATQFHLNARRIIWLALQTVSRFVWRLMLTAELGSDAPRVLTKNLYAVAHKAITINNRV